MQPNPYEENIEQNYYALTNLAKESRIITQAIEKMPELRKKIDKQLTTNKKSAKITYESLRNIFDLMINGLTQISLLLLESNENQLSAYTHKILSSLKTFNLMTPDYGTLCKILNEYLSQLLYKNQTTNARVVGRLMNRIKLGYYPTDLEHIKHLSRSISIPNNMTANLFDPCCGCGLALRSLANGLVSQNSEEDATTAMTYGVELDECRAEESMSRLGRVGIGSFYHSRISHEAFHLMLLNPPYLSVMSDEGSNFRSEKRFLVDSIPHLMMDGLLIYIIPYYRLTDDVCKVLTDHFTNITIWRFYGDEFAKFKQIAIIGKRKKQKSDEATAIRMSGIVFEIEKIPELSRIPDGYYQLPSVTKQVNIFKGSLFNVTELAEQLDKSDSFSKLFEKNKLDDGYNVSVYNPFQIKSFRGAYNNRKQKNDVIDAIIIANYIRTFGSENTTLPDDSLLSLKQLTRFRTNLVENVSALKNQTIAILDKVFPEFASLFSDTFGETAKQLLLTAPTPDEVLKLSTKRLYNLVNKASKGLFKKEFVSKLADTAKNSFGIKISSSACSFEIKQIINQIVFIENQISDLEIEIHKIYNTLDTFLTSIPGIGGTLAPVILAEIGDIENFDSPNKLVAFAGIDPSSNQSGNSNSVNEKTSKRGSPYLRHALFTAAFVAMNNDQHLRSFYDRKKAEGKHHFVAMAGVQRKLLGIIWAVLSEKRPYRPYN